MKTKNNFWLLIAMLLSLTFTFSACGGGGDDDIIPREQQPNTTPNGGGTEAPQGTLQLTQICGTCLGDKTCKQCKGTGKGCSLCKSKGIYCKECGTSGECTYCYGSGECQRCYGKKGEECIKCGWYHGKCRQCGGSGKSLGIKCQACDGSGVCDKCHGNWWTDCSSCSGTGNCSQCRGKKVCQICSGNPPTCTTCGGDGHCNACNNSDGKCKDCTGTGEVNLSSFSFTDASDKATVNIQCTVEWTVSADADWISLSQSSGKGNGSITVTIAKNPTASSRSGVITFTYGKSKQTVNVQQDGEALRLTVAPNTIILDANGTSQSVKISSNSSWTVSAEDSWLTCSPANGSGDVNISVGASAVAAGSRYTTLTVTDATGKASAEVLIKQAESAEAYTALKNLLEKPLGTVNVNIKTASASAVTNAVTRLYKIKEFSSGDFVLYANENPSLNLTYQGLNLWGMYITIEKDTRHVAYVFEIEKSKASGGYKPYLKNILQDFKYNLGITLESTNSSYYLESYKVRDTNKNTYYVDVKESEYYDTYDYTIGVFYH